MKLSSYLLSLSLVSGTIALPKRGGSHTSFNWNETNFFLAFGDSYSFVQGTYGRQNYSFIGDQQNYSFTPAQLLSNEIIQNQISTSAGGPNWVEYLTGCFSGLPSKCSKQLWDFAFAGSDVSTFTPLHHPFTVSLVNQIAQWKTYAQPFIPVSVSTALVAIWIGINDISDTAKYTFPHGNATSFTSLYAEIINTEFDALEPLYKAGYRKYLFMALPPLERTPSNALAGPAKALPNATMVAAYNAALSLRARQFQLSHHGVRALVFDTHAYLSSLLDSPGQYGIVNTTSYCRRYDAPDISTNYAAYGCLPINQYFWYNTGHITYRVHELLAGEVGRFLDTASKKKGKGDDDC